MKTIVKKTREYGGLVLEERPVPTPGDNEVLIKTKKTAICGTDLHIYSWNSWAKKTIKTPQIIGHEFVGEVAEIGRGVTNVTVGQLVSGEGHLFCGQCRRCMTGTPHLCREASGIGVNMDGAFAEYFTFPASNLWICDENIPLNVLAIMDPLGNATHTVRSFDVLGEDVLVTGAGPIGLMSVPILRRAGARNIVVTDINAKRLELAKVLGATATVDVRTEKIADIMPNLKPAMVEGFDIGLEMSGSAEGFNDMIGTMANGGKIAILGFLPPEAQIEWDTMIFKSLTLKGVYGREMFDTWYQMTALLQSGLVDDILKIITHEFHYTDFIEGFELMKSGKSGKIILDWMN
ncbi:MAG: L-threonine 3-dehydrogenase [Defluviitaleaceae bacterium]|nr:L-threonine 3-dehydrogenase [Defluviitaleaceae bacterium]MCL2263924.1 L-threonine 3-dehydrogenase [Defluviitaleaceae bacterium]